MIFLSLLSLLFGAIGAIMLIKLSHRLELIAYPDHRSSHASPIPKGGGIGILLAFLVTSTFLGITSEFWVPVTLVALLSLWGDRVHLSPKLRFVVQCLASFFIVHSAILDPPIAITIFFTVFIVGTANYYNFMDGINGIAAVTAIVAYGLLALFILLTDGDTYLAILALSIVSACLGFLPFNFPKAKIFMGDVGSILLGFVFACMVILISRDFLDIIILSAFIFPFYADEFSTIIVRLKDGQGLLQPHRRHIYQLLANELSYSHWKVTIGYALLQLVVGFTVLWGRLYGMTVVLIVLTVYLAFFLVAAHIVRRKAATLT